MGCAVFLAFLSVGSALEMVPFLLDGFRSIQHHGTAAVRAEGQSRKQIRFLHMLGRSALMASHLLHDIPFLLGDQRRVGVLDDDLLVLRDGDASLVLEGDGGAFHRVGMPKVHHVAENMGDRCSAPSIGTIHIHASGHRSVGPVIVVGGGEDFLITEDSCNLAGAFATGAEVEDVLHHRGGFLVGNDLLAVSCFLLVAIGRLAAQPFTTLRLHLLDGTNLFAGILGMKLICPVADGIEVTAAFHQRVHTVVDRNKADALLREVDLRVVAYLKILSAQPGHILDDQGLHLSGFDHLDDLLPGGAVKVGAGVAIVSEEQGVFKTTVLCVLLQQELLMNDAVGFASPVIFLAESAV